MTNHTEYDSAGYPHKVKEPAPQAPAESPKPEPTIGECERFINKMEACEGIAAKLILLKNFLLKHCEADSSESGGQPGQWRVGRKVPINVYEDERPVCQCQTALDAKRIVEAVNARYQAESGGQMDLPITAKTFRRGWMGEPVGPGEEWTNSLADQFAEAYARQVAKHAPHAPLPQHSDQRLPDCDNPPKSGCPDPEAYAKWRRGHRSPTNWECYEAGWQARAKRALVDDQLRADQIAQQQNEIWKLEAEFREHAPRQPKVSDGK